MANGTLVTGSSGQVGSHLVQLLPDVVGMDRLAAELTAVVGDVRVASMPTCRRIIHCAAHIDVAASVQDPRLDAADNVDGLLAVLEHARRQDVERFVFFSSAAVYGQQALERIPETAELRPQSPYGVSKVAGEYYVRLYQALHGLPTVIVRPFNIFGGRISPKSPYAGAIVKMVDRALSGKPPIVFGDGSQTRDFVHVRDVAQAVKLALDRKEMVGNTFNIGSGQSTSILQLAQLIIQACGASPEIEFGPPRPGDILHSRPNIDRLLAAGYKPTTSLATDLLAVVEERRLLITTN
jgi:UDP-glucose 4-epimerase